MGTGSLDAAHLPHRSLARHGRSGSSRLGAYNVALALLRLGDGMKQIGWFAFQIAVFLGIQYAVSTDPKLDHVSGLAVGFAGGFCAWFLTLCLIALGDFFRFLVSLYRRVVIGAEERRTTASDPRLLRATANESRGTLRLPNSAGTRRRLPRHANEWPDSRP